MFSIHPIPFFFVTFTLFSAGALFGLWLRSSKSSQVETEELSVKALLGASLGLFGVLLGFTFSMANSRFEERRHLEIAEAGDLKTLWLRTSFLPEPVRSAERSLLRQYLPVRLRFFDEGPEGHGYEGALRESAQLGSRMWYLANDESMVRRDPGTLQFMAALSEGLETTEMRTAASENRIPALSWAILLLLGMMACVLLAVDMRSRSYVLRGLLQIALAAALALTYDIDTPRKGFVQVGQQSMMRVQELMNATPAD